MGLFKLVFITLILASLLVWYGYDNYQAGNTIINEHVDKFIKPIFQFYDYLKGLMNQKNPVCEQSCILTSDNYETVNVTSAECRDACIDHQGYLVNEKKIDDCFEKYDYDNATARKSRTYVREELNKMIVQCEAETGVNNTMNEDCLYEIMRAGIEPFSTCQHVVE